MEKGTHISVSSGSCLFLEAARHEKYHSLVVEDRAASVSTIIMQHSYEV